MRLEKIFGHHDRQKSYFRVDQVYKNIFKCIHVDKAQEKRVIYCGWGYL